MGTTLSLGYPVTVHCIMSFSCTCLCMHSQTTAGTFLPPLFLPLDLCISIFETHVSSATQHALSYLVCSSGEWVLGSLQEGGPGSLKSAANADYHVLTDC